MGIIAASVAILAVAGGLISRSLAAQRLDTWTKEQATPTVALAALKADGPLVAFEVILENIPPAKAKPTRAKPLLELSPFQPVDRDFAFVVENKVKAADIVRTAQGIDKKLITNVTVFDVYEGTGIEPGKKSVAIAVTIQPRDKTMTDAEIDALGQKIVVEVSKKTGGVLRG